MMKNKIYYPAVFQTEDKGYTVWLPDVAGCASQGDSLEEAAENMTAALGLFMEEYRENNSALPTPTEPGKIKLKKGEFVVLLAFDWLAYLQKHNQRAVKKTLTIPAWLNTMAEERHVNFSRILQNALLEELHPEQRG